jgi:hypothetical protein
VEERLTDRIEKRQDVVWDGREGGSDRRLGVMRDAGQDKGTRCGVWKEKKQKGLTD